MARKRNSATDEETDVNLTPMLDVTFILLIFFIVTAQFVKEPGATIEREKAQTASDRKPAILIALDADDGVWINKQLVDMRDVVYLVRDLREDNPKGELVIQSDKDSTSGALVSLMDKVQAADPMGSIHVATQKL